MKSTKMGSNVVKNRAPAPIQITAEQIVREAADRQELFPIEPVVQIHDGEEYQTYLRDRRQQYENNIRYRREHIGTWIKYAKFEEENQEYERSRSIYERALEVDQYRNSELWLRYAEYEMRNEFINHARNVFDRAVQLLPRVDYLWYKYIYLEEMVQDIPKCRTIFERWMEWLPDGNAWYAYVQFECRQQQQQNSTTTKVTDDDGIVVDRAEHVFQRYVQAYPTMQSYIRFAKWAEYDKHNILLSRSIYEKAFVELEMEETQQHILLYKQFAAFEERQREYERAKLIYQHALQLFKLGPYSTNTTTNQEENDDNDENDYFVSKDENKKREEFYQSYITFEKKYGNRDSIENVIITKQRNDYQQHLLNNPYDYDQWFELIRLEEDQQQQQQQQQNKSKSTNKSKGSSTHVMDPELQRIRNGVRDTYERAIANVPPTLSTMMSSTGSSSRTTKQNHHRTIMKDDWRRYIYLWIYYAVYEEIMNRDVKRAIQIYETCLQHLQPYQEYFIFTKVYILTARAYIRNHDIQSARKLLGKAIGICSGVGSGSGKSKKRRKDNNDDDDTKTISYQQKCEKIFLEYINIELSLGEMERCRTLYTNYLKLMPSNCLAWCKFVDFEKTIGETIRCRAIYELAIQQPMLDMPEIIWKSYIDFEIDENENQNVRKLYERLLNKTQHVKVYISYAQFEASNIPTSSNNNNYGEDDESMSTLVTTATTKARSIYEKAYTTLKQQYEDFVKNHTLDQHSVGTETHHLNHQNTIIELTSKKEDRVLLLDAWRIFEKTYGTNETLVQVENRMPRRIKRKRMRYDDDTGMELGWEEYFDYQFPDDDLHTNNNAADSSSKNQNMNSFKILEMAAKWKEQQQQQQKSNDDDDDDDEEADDDDTNLDSSDDDNDDME